MKKRSRNRTSLAMESLESRRLLAVEHRMLAVIYPNAEYKGQAVTISPETLKAVIKQIEVDFPALVNQIAGDQIQIRTHVEVVDRVMSITRDDGLVDEKPADVDVKKFIGSGWYDHYMLVAGDAVGWRGAGCGYLHPHMMSTSVAVPRNAPNADSSPMYLHEWMHALERFYFPDPRVTDDKNPQGGHLGIHDAELFGYTDNLQGRSAWAQWYRDFLTDNIKNLKGDGRNTGLGLGPDAWAIGTIRNGAPLTPGSQLDRPDVSSQSVSWLSDVKWGWTPGGVQRNLSADGTIKLDGTSYSKGIGSLSERSVVVNLSGKADQFQAIIGLNDTVPSTAGSVYFEVYGDDNLLYRSGKVTGSTPRQQIDLSVLGVRQLRLVVDDAGDGSTGDIAAWANALVTPFYGKFISDIDWGTSSVGWGSIQLDHNSYYQPIKINKVPYGKGLGAVPNSSITIPINGKYSRFASDVGIDDVMTDGGSSEFMVYGDGVLLYRSGVRTFRDNPLSFSVDVTNVKELRLASTDAGDSNFGDHAVWGNARLTLPSQTSPGVPTTVVATPGNGRVSLTWSAPSSNGGSPIKDYIVLYKKSTESSWSTFNDGISAATSATVTGLTNGMPYMFRVGARNATGIGAFTSATLSVTPRTTPTAPINLVASIGDRQAKLTWSAPASSGGAKITDYVVQYKTSTASLWITFRDGISTKTSAVVKGLINGTSYVFRVAAVNIAGAGAFISLTKPIRCRPFQTTP